MVPPTRAALTSNSNTNEHILVRAQTGALSPLCYNKLKLVHTKVTQGLQEEIHNHERFSRAEYKNVVPFTQTEPVETSENAASVLRVCSCRKLNLVSFLARLGVLHFACSGVACIGVYGNF